MADAKVQTEASSVWDAACAVLRDQVTDTVWGSTFQELAASSLDDGVLTLSVPSQVLRQRIEQRYLGLIEGVTRRMLDELGEATVVATGGLAQAFASHTTLIQHVEPDLDRLQRHFYTTSSCGVCGKASLDAVAVHGRYAIGESSFSIAADTLGRLPEALLGLQSVFGKTGGIHAAALSRPGTRALPEARSRHAR